MERVFYSPIATQHLQPLIIAESLWIQADGPITVTDITRAGLALDPNPLAQSLPPVVALILSRDAVEPVGDPGSSTRFCALCNDFSTIECPQRIACNSAL